MLQVDLPKPPDIASATTATDGECCLSQPLPGFEGPEKILEVEFIPALNDSYTLSSPLSLSSTEKPSLRKIGRTVWDKILAEAHCEILSLTSNSQFDAYVLSESSLFVYDTKVYIKTCGTTTLLRCLNLLISSAKTVSMELDWLAYSRKDFLFPSFQKFPHTSFEEEVAFAKKVPFGSKGKLLKGGAFVLGDVTSDHFCIYVADHSDNYSLDCNVIVMMYELPSSVRQVFYRDTSFNSAQDTLRVREESNLEKIIRHCDPNPKPEEVLFDDVLFEPCGYSLNVLSAESFYTVHVTPEEHCCYASFETNANLDSLSKTGYENMLKSVLKSFQPRRFAVAIFADKKGLEKMDKSLVDYKFFNTQSEEYVRRARSSAIFGDDYVCQLANFEKRSTNEVESEPESGVSSESAETTE